MDTKLNKQSSVSAERTVLPQPTPILDTTRCEVREFLRNKRLGEILVHMGALSAQQMDEAAAAAVAAEEKLGRFLMRMQVISSEALCRAMSMQSGLPIVDLAALPASAETGMLFTHSLMVKYGFAPFEDAGAFVCIAVIEPLPLKIQRELERIPNRRIQQFITTEEALSAHLTALQAQRKARKHPRYALSLPARYQFCGRTGVPSDETLYFAKTFNLSEGGLALEGKPSLLQSAPDIHSREMCARVLIKGLDGDIESICRLRWVRKTERDHRNQWNWQIGLEVIGLREDDRHLLANLCARAHVENGGIME